MGLWVLAGIVAFLIVEKTVRILKGSHGHSHGPAPPKVDDKKGNGNKKDKTKPKESGSKDKGTYN